MSRNSSSNKHVKRMKKKSSKSLTSFLSTDETRKDIRKNYSNRWNRNNGMQEVRLRVISTSSASLIRDVACIQQKSDCDEDGDCDSNSANDVDVEDNSDDGGKHERKQLQQQQSQQPPQQQ